MSETRGYLNVRHPSEPDLENGILRQESDMTSFRVHMRGGYDGGYDRGGYDRGGYDEVDMIVKALKEMERLKKRRLNQRECWLLRLQSESQRFMDPV